jgi:sulfur-oxidizing protein SoxZ
MSKPTKIRAKLKNGIVDFRMLMHHEMESGFIKDELTGDVIPAWFIQEFNISLNSKLILSGQLGPTISKNPYLRCKFTGEVGDKITVMWSDNRGFSRSDESIIKI